MTMTPVRYASVIRLRPEMEQEYRRLHLNIWPAVAERIQRSGMRNYSIFLRDGFLFSYFEYVGEDFAADMAAMAQDEATTQWWALTDPCQQALATAGPEEWWAPMVEMCHLD